MTDALVHLPGFRLEPPHPFAGREAYQCPVCNGISYPPSADSTCGYCEDDAEEAQPEEAAIRQMDDEAPPLPGSEAGDD